MANCKASIRQGEAGRYSKRCDDSATEAVVFSSWLDDGFIVQTQMPLCSKHLYEKVEQLTEAGIQHYTVTLGINGLVADGKV